MADKIVNFLWVIMLFPVRIEEVSVLAPLSMQGGSEVVGWAGTGRNFVSLGAVAMALNVSFLLSVGVTYDTVGRWGEGGAWLRRSVLL